ncbi:MAG: type I-MYXAN CRISPR-associated protein Cas6/Cmx6 [Candidatus Latescibacteria bacterium]|nr:type I-MYXAN CRISPR-associated protein Cas6/Cmx6 [Candidatus Latescibacterota bacterium]
MPVVDLTFRLRGNLLPADHAYHLFSAVSKVIPEIHGDEEVGLHAVSGRLAGDRKLVLTENSTLTFRIDAGRIGQLLPLAGKPLQVENHKLRVGVPTTYLLIPSARLYSRLVVIKGFMEPEPFLEAAQRQLDEMDIRGKPLLVAQPQSNQAGEHQGEGSRSPYLRRTLRIRDKEIVGFALRVEELTAEESIRLQEKGVGGRRRFGCGLFIADRR